MKTAVSVVNKSLINKDKDTHKAQLLPYEYLMFTLTVTNDGSDPIVIARDDLKFTSFFNEQELHSRCPFIREHLDDHTIGPGESRSFSQRQFIPFHLLSIAPVVLDVDFRLDLAINSATSVTHKETLQVDFSDTRCLQTPKGANSYYYQSGKVIFYHTLRSWFYDERPLSIVKLDPKTLKILDPYYALDDKKVFYAGILRKGIKGAGFHKFNHIFAGNSEMVLTKKGNAKVEDPASFEALGDGDEDASTGYGRDAKHVYFCDLHASTPHANRVKACKDPSSFTAIDHQYGKDSKNVYRGATKVAKADAASFERLNDCYSKDKKYVFSSDLIVNNVDVETFSAFSGHYGRDKSHIFYRGYIIKGADPDSFEQLVSPDGQLLLSWSKDKKNYYKRKYKSTKEEFLDYIKKYY